MDVLCRLLKLDEDFSFEAAHQGLFCTVDYMAGPMLSLFVALREIELGVVFVCKRFDCRNC